MAARTIDVEVESRLSPEFEERRQRWAAEHQPVGEAASWALDRAVAATLRIERCEQAFEEVVDTVQQRAALAWNEDRAFEAAKVAARLSKNPVVASRQLQTTRDGVMLMIAVWIGLAEALEHGDWSESQASKALDLLGVDPEARTGRKMIDPRDGSDPIAHRNTIVAEELERLEQLRDVVMNPLEVLERDKAMAGASAMLAKDAKLVLRYEREAWRRFRESMKVVQSRAKETALDPAPKQALPPKPIPIPKPAPPPPKQPERTFEEERRALLAEAAPFVEAANRLRSMGLIPPLPVDDGDDDAWLDAMEAQLEAMPGRPGNFVPIAAGVRGG